MGSVPKQNEPTLFDGNIYFLCRIVKFVVAPAAEAELGTLFMTATEGKIIRRILQKLGHPKPRTPIHYNDKTTAGIANNMVKKHQLRSMEMSFLGSHTKPAKRSFDIQWHLGQEHLGDCYTKTFDGKQYCKVRLWYLHEKKLPRVLPRATNQSTLRRCVGTLTRVC